MFRTNTSFWLLKGKKDVGSSSPPSNDQLYVGPKPVPVYRHFNMGFSVHGTLSTLGVTSTTELGADDEPGKGKWISFFV